FFFVDPLSSLIFTLSLHDALPIFTRMNLGISGFLQMSFGTWQLIMNAVILVIVFFTVRQCIGAGTIVNMVCVGYGADFICWLVRSEEHTSELQSRFDLVCRLLLEK